MFRSDAIRTFEEHAASDAARIEALEMRLAEMQDVLDGVRLACRTGWWCEPHTRLREVMEAIGDGP